MHVTILMGSNSPERDVSLRSAAAVGAALERSGHTVRLIDIPSVRAVIELDFGGTDLVFPALHGGDGEDGHVQALLEIIGAPYVFSGPLASAVAMDKAAAKRIMIGAGIATPDWLLVTWDRAASGPIALSGKPTSKAGAAGGRRRRADAGGAAVLSLEHIQARAGDELGYPVVVKLNGGGSSVGVAIVEEPGAFAGAFSQVAAAATGQQAGILVERFIPGRELTAAVLLGRRLPLLEIRPHTGFYDYQNKYTQGATEYLVPAPVHSPHYEKMCADALQLYDLLGCQGVARVDFRFDGKHHYCLEINTIPGLTELSLVPMAARAVGISFEAMVEDLCRDALLRAGRPTRIRTPGDPDGATRAGSS
ncbi:MAG: D-alanine--D-alanine ligase [Candidatus Krumholzibacteria bacterium]|nr:D-alanine--D-alanine ligase [Candidatus Krumholzibacteria bacterium]